MISKSALISIEALLRMTSCGLTSSDNEQKKVLKEIFGSDSNDEMNDIERPKKKSTKIRTNLEQMRKSYVDLVASKGVTVPFSQAAMHSVNMEEIMEIQKSVLINDKTVVVPEDKNKETEYDRAIIFRIFKYSKKKIHWFDDEKIEKAFEAIMNKVESLGRGKYYGSIKVVFLKKEDAIEMSHQPLKTTDINFIPLYIGKKMVEVRVERLPYRQEPLDIIASTRKPIMGQMELVKAFVKENKLWKGKTITMLIQVNPSALMEIPETLQIDGEPTNIFVQARRPRCFGCDEVGYIKKNCPKDQNPVEEVREEEENKKRKIRKRKTRKRKMEKNKRV